MLSSRQHSNTLCSRNATGGRTSFLPRSIGDTVPKPAPRHDLMTFDYSNHWFLALLVLYRAHRKEKTYLKTIAGLIDQLQLVVLLEEAKKLK